MSRHVVLKKSVFHLLEPSPSAISGKNFKTWKHIRNDSTLRSGFVPENALGWYRILNFSQDSRIRFKSPGAHELEVRLACIKDFYADWMH